MTTTTVEEYCPEHLVFPLESNTSKARISAMQRNPSESLGQTAPPPFISPPSYSDSGVNDNELDPSPQPTPQIRNTSLDSVYNATLDSTNTQIAVAARGVNAAIKRPPSRPKIAGPESTRPAWGSANANTTASRTKSMRPALVNAAKARGVDAAIKRQPSRPKIAGPEITRPAWGSANANTTASRSRTKSMRTALVNAAKSMANEVGDTTDAIKLDASYSQH